MAEKKLSEESIYRRKGTDILVKIVRTADGKINLHVVSGPLLINDFWVSKNFFYRNFYES